MFLLWFMFGFGILEILSNGFHLSKLTVQKIGSSARRQHQELPQGISDAHYFAKALVMFIFGILFTLSSALALFSQAGLLPATVTIFAFGAYGLIQAVVYFRGIKVWPAAIVYNVFVILYFVGV